MLQRFRRQRERRRQADALYSALVAQARSSEFYTELGVPDSLDGRFEMVVLHVYALTRGVEGRSQAQTELSRLVMEAMIDDMDRTLREIGVGDMSVGKKVKQMAAAFYGRARAYDSALAAGDAELHQALLRNVYAGDDVDSAVVDRIARYLRAAIVAVTAAAEEDIETGAIVFPVP